ncbi:MAG: hypothetical protein B6I20_00195 [Bacteroidetes bacterium 4572_117]|nr:MAG: hypothetical protein B6I20_00195 [Bacteroidetes bacterium 4572_117]
MKNYLFISILLIIGINSKLWVKKQAITNPDNSKIIGVANGHIENKSAIDILGTGNPFITNYNFELDANDQIWAIIQDKSGAMLFGSKNGLIVFDGREWDMIKMPYVPLVMAYLDNTDKILVGCENDYGYLEKDKKGSYKYISLIAKELNTGDITQIEITDNEVFFYSSIALIQLTKSNLGYKNSWYAGRKEPYDGLIRIKNQIFVKVKEKGIFKIGKGGAKKQITTNDNIDTESILFNFSFSEKNTLIGTDSSKLYLFDGKELQNYDVLFKNYLYNNQLINGINLSDTMFALSTITGGAIIVNKKTGDAQYTINYQSGLPDDEIYAIGKDKSGALWLSHEFGISRVNYNLPVKTFLSYPGMEGRLIDVQTFDSTLYVATTQGLFYLDTLTDLKEIEVYRKKKLLVNNNKTKLDVAPSENITINEKKTVRKKSLLQKWKDWKKKRLEKKQQAENIITEPLADEIKIDEKKPVSTNEKKYKTKYVKEKKYVNQNIGYVFKKNDSINSKCRQLVPYKGYLFVASINGLYVIHKNKTKTLLQNTYINQILVSTEKNIIYVATNQGVVMLYFNKGKWEANKSIKPINLNDNILSIIDDNDKFLWLASNDMVYKLEIDENNKGEIIGVYDLPGNISDNVLIRKIQNKLFFLSSKQIFQYNPKTDKIEKSHQLLPDTLAISKYIFTQPSTGWFKASNKWVNFGDYYQINETQLAILNIFDKINNIKVDDEGNIWVIDGNINLYKILPANNFNIFSNEFRGFFKEIKDETGKKFPLNKIKFDYQPKSFTFTITAPFYIKQDAIKYQYRIEGIMSDWSDWRSRPDFEVFVARPGKFIVNVRAINIFGNISTSQKVFFEIKAPFWMAKWFYVLIAGITIIIIILIVILIIKKRERKLLKVKIDLENKVRDRTLEISLQKEEIEHKSKEITDSINYARNIQRAVMPPIDILNETVSDYFLINKPRDIVSGDYYWLGSKNGHMVITVADCTGHGVPGAFLSMLGLSFLKEITNKMENLQANIILDKLRKKIIEALHQTGDEDERKDGMDMALCILDLNNMKLQFAGAYNPLFYARGNHIEVLKGDRMPIGIHTKANVPFTGYEIEVQKGDTFYIFSDGFIDQFGGEQNRKFLTDNFKKLLCEIQGLDMQTQKKLIIQAFEIWKGDEIQIDDILIIGVKI